MSNEPLSADPDEAAANAYQEFLRSNLENARAQCRQVLDAFPNHLGALQVLGVTEMHDRNYSEAIAALERVVNISPSADAYFKLASSYYHNKNLEPALKAVDKTIELDPNYGGIHTLRAAILHGIGRFEDALAAALEGERLDPVNDIASARVASILEKLGRFGEAQQQFMKARDLGSRAKPYSVLGFERALFERIATSRKAPLAEPVHHFGSAAPVGFRSIVLACCDAVYFGKYGFNFINSFAWNAQRQTLLHVHVVDPNAALDQMLKRIEQEIPLVNLAISTEISPFEKQGGQGAPHTYYSCCRFLRLPYFLAKYRVPIVCLDIDAVLEKPVDEIVECAAGGDIGLFRRDPPHSPWLDIPAGVVVANPTPRAQRFFELAGNYMVHFMRRGEAKWHLDQAALYCVLRMLERFGGSVDTRLPSQVSKQFVPGALLRFPDSPSVVWLPKSLQDSVWQIGHDHDYRLRDKRFTRYSSGGPGPGSARA